MLGAANKVFFLILKDLSWKKGSLNNNKRKELDKRKIIVDAILKIKDKIEITNLF